MRDPLAPGQLRVLQAIEDIIEIKGFPPTIREIADALDFSSTNGVHDHLRALERKGYIWRNGKARCLRVLVPSARAPVVKPKRGPL